jgi:hypothetical protein
MLELLGDPEAPLATGVGVPVDMNAGCVPVEELPATIPKGLGFGGGEAGLGHHRHVSDRSHD